MPREIVHWNVLQDSIDRLDSSKAPATKACLKVNGPACYLGAVAHDAPYYLRFGGDPFEAYSKCLHGTYGNDTFDPLRSIAKQIVMSSELNRELLWAFLLGMTTHYSTDVSYHPMIYYVTGRYYDDSPTKREHARSLHREFEVYLDSYYRNRLAFANKGRIGHSLVSLGPAKEVIAEILAKGIVLEESGLDEESVKKEWLSSFRYISDLQLLFLSLPAGALARILRYLSFGKLRPIETLFLFGRSKAPEYFYQPIEYKNPVTGEDKKETLESLFEEAVTECLRIFELFEPLVAGESTDVEEVLGAVKGLSLNFGEYCVESKAARYFSKDL